MTGKHTPGPWKIKITERHGLTLTGCYSSIYTAKGEYICEDVSTEANAHLIAAAPETAAERDDFKSACDLWSAKVDRLNAINAELLAALVDIEGSGSCYCPRDVDGRRLGNTCSICVARAVIAKTKEQDRFGSRKP